MKTDTFTPIDIFNLVLSGKRKIFPQRYWQEQDALENAAVITRYMIEKLLNWDDNDIREKICIETFKQYRLRGMVYTLFGEHTWKAVNNAYPDKFLPWELKGSTVGRWDKDLRIKAIKWLVVDKLHLPPEHYMYVDANDFAEYGLSGLLSYYNGSPLAALREAFPNIIFDNVNSTIFGIRTSPEVKEMIQKLAKYNQCTATEWLEKMVRTEFKKNESSLK